MATKKTTTAKKTKAKTTKSSKKAASPAKKKQEPVSQPAKQKVQLPSPLTPLLAVVAIVFTYIAFSLAIDSGSYWHYAAGFYFFYQSVRLTKISIVTRMNDKKRRASKA